MNLGIYTDSHLTFLSGCVELENFSYICSPFENFPVLITAAVILVAYMLGSIPSAVWIGCAFYGTDVREHGSRNAGATNTLRVLGRRAAIVVFSIDFLKGLAAVMLYHFVKTDMSEIALSNLKIILIGAAVTGHIFPVFASFRGGKGVATTAGAVMGIFPAAVLICLGIFLIIFITTQYVTLGSVVAGVSFPLLDIIVFHERSGPLMAFSVLVAMLFIFMHRKNIKRLLKGEESKISIKKNI